MDPEKDDYEVGFGKPPKKTKFASGQSGNPKGRPKGSKNVNKILDKVGRQRVKVKGEQGSRSISKAEAAYTQLVNQAASGNLAAIRELARLHRAYDDPVPTAAPQPIRTCDELVIKSICKRIRESHDPDTIPNPTPKLGILTKSEDPE